MKKLFDGEPQTIPSPFVLSHGDEERRLSVGESLYLATGNNNPVADGPTTLNVQPDHDHISLIIVGDHFYRQRAEWGMISRGSGNGRKEFGSTFSENAFTSMEGGRKCIAGTCLQFDDQNLHLSGDGWTLEYKPL